MATATATTTQVYRLFIKATPEAIWEAITKPEFTERYFYGVRIDTKAGAARHPRVRRLGHLRRGPGLRVRPAAASSSHGWQSKWNPELSAEEPSRVTWEIEPGEDGVSLLTVVHDQLEGAPKTAASVAGPGWMRVLSGLKTLLETGEPLA